MQSGASALPALPDSGPGDVGRMAGIDVARGLAVLGMVGAHQWIGEDLSWAPSSWLALVEGRPSILFAVLAGVSIALLSGGVRVATGEALVRARTRILVRAAWVFAIGGVLEFFNDWVPIILGVYGVLFVLALPVLRWSPRRLFVLAAVVAVLGPPVCLLLGQVAMATQFDAGQPFIVLMFTGFYPATVWAAFVFAGLAIGRLDLRSPRMHGRLLVAGSLLAVSGYAAGWLTTLLFASGGSAVGLEAGMESLGQWDPAWLSGAQPHSGTTFEALGSTGVAVAVLGLCLIVASRAPRLVFPLASVGAMALTVYSVQIVLIWLGGDDRPFGVTVWLLASAVTMVVTALWRLLWARGPLERLLTWSARLASDPRAGVDRRPAGLDAADRRDRVVAS